MVEINELTKKMCGVLIGNEQCDAKLEVDVNNLTFSFDTVKDYLRLLKVFSKDGTLLSNLCLVQLLVQMGDIYENMKLVEDSFWFDLMVRILLEISFLVFN